MQHLYRISFFFNYLFLHFDLFISLLLRLGGIILSYKNVKINSSVEMNDEEHFILDYVADVYLFTPQIGSTLTGR